MEEKTVRKTSRQLQAEQMREKLQSIVFEMAKTQPLEEIKIKTIAEKADISVGNFYQYFDSKESALIYSYKEKDDIWENLHFEKIRDPLIRVQRIVATHLYSMIENSLCWTTQLYLAQLKKYDSYFFTPDRYVHRIMRESIAEGQKAGEFKTDWEAEEIGMRILNFSRGMVYNYCVEHKEDPEGWIRRAVQLQSEYMSLFVTDPSQLDLKKQLAAVRRKAREDS